MTDTSEKGLESLIVESLLSDSGYLQGSNSDFNSEYAIDMAKFTEFIKSTQPKIYNYYGLDTDSPIRQKLLNRLQGEIAKHGIIEVFRSGFKEGPNDINIYYSLPSPNNTKSVELYSKNIFSVTRQLHYSKNETQLSLDICIFINGLPIITFELKNKLTKQTVEDAIQQYMRDRDPRDLIFHFGKCIVHFALDDHEARMCTHLKKGESWFLPFNKGYNDGAGNPPNPDGIATDYLWKEVLAKESLSNIIENYALIVEERDEKTKAKKRYQIFPRYHQLDVVRKLLTSVINEGVGRKYLIQHSAGSGKSNSISWFAHQVIEAEKNGTSLFDSIIIVTDRRVLDKQLRDNIKRFAQVASIVGAVTEGSYQLRQFIEAGKKIIITTVQKFPFILDEIGDEHRHKKFAIIIDEAHSSQGGRASAKMHMALSDKLGEYSATDEELDIEDIINNIVESRKMIKNASYFAFTATPKAKTLEMFGDSIPVGEIIKHSPFHSYTMKQAIQEGFILDVLEHYTTVSSYYKLIKAIEDDPKFDNKKAQKKLRRYVESHDKAIKTKAEIMIDDFITNVAGQYKIGGKARAMVICDGIKRAIQYFHAFNTYLTEIKSPFKTIVAFSGESDYDGIQVTESSLNGFPSNLIPETFKNDPYRFLIVADKFQTGYDEPLLQTMYVDKHLSGIKAVQTLSRLNRAHPKKHDTFILDFMNSVDVIEFAFSDYYRTTILSKETDPNILHTTKADLDKYQVYEWNQVNDFVTKYLTNAPRESLDPILDACVTVYNQDLDEDSQVDFKSKAKSFCRIYNFLATILPYSVPDWEKLSIFLNFLTPKLPAPKENDLSKGILEAIDMDSYRAEIMEARKIKLADEDAEIDPNAQIGTGYIPDPELDLLSNIIKTFNEQYGNIPWKDIDKIHKVITEDIPAKVSADVAYQNAIMQNDEQNARIEHNNALSKVIVDLLLDHTELYKQFMDNKDFRKWLESNIFNITYKKAS